MRNTALAATGLVAIAVCVTALAGCTAPAAQSVEPQTLTLFHVDGGPDLDPAVAWFADAVAERSNGAITIEVTQACCGRESDNEEALVKAIADGEADLGWVGTRVFAELGVDSLRALTAPFLIGDYPLQQAALESDEAAAAVKDVDTLGVQSIALVPGSIRYPLGAESAITGLADWDGVTVASFHSAQNADSFLALGANPVDVSFDERDAGLGDGTIQALENSVIMQDLGREVDLPYATIDAGLWPRTSALIAGPNSDAADGPVAEILRRAAADVVARTGELADLDTAAMTTSCVDGARFALAGAVGLSAMRDAVAPVWSGIRSDEEAAPLMSAVLALAEENDPAVVEIAAGCDGPPPSVELSNAGATDPSVLNGSFQTAEYTEEQLLAAGFPAAEARNASAQFTLVFSDGDWRLIADDDGQSFGCTGEYTVDDDHVEIEYDGGGDCGTGGVFFTADFTVDETALTLTEVESAFWTDEWLFGNAPLARVG